MAKIAGAIPALAVLALGLAMTSPAVAAGKAPTQATCNAHPTSAVVRGGCLVISRKMGNCMACHAIAGTTMDGNLGPALVDVPKLVGSKKAAAARLWDPEKFNSNTAMPAFGKDHILTKEQIHDVVEFLWTL